MQPLPPFLKRITVNRWNLMSNRHKGTSLPVFRVTSAEGEWEAHTLFVHGNSWFIYDEAQPLAAGATVWLETYAALIAVTEQGWQTMPGKPETLGSDEATMSGQPPRSPNEGQFDAGKRGTEPGTDRYHSWTSEDGALYIDVSGQRTGDLTDYEGFAVRRWSNAKDWEDRHQENLQFGAVEALERLGHGLIPPRIMERFQFANREEWILFLAQPIADHYLLSVFELMMAWGEHYGISYTGEQEETLSDQGDADEQRSAGGGPSV